MNDYQKAQAAKILGCYGVDANALQKANEEANIQKSESEDKKEEKEDSEDDDEIEIDKKEMIDEHKKLVKVLESDSHKDDKEEAKKQKKELEEYQDKK